ncbi:uncharacterized protein LOC129922177 [Biomphalaria glabrata]|uniref:Uncharacterized protein LOC129922177 n=1 Tax=Biomphalaria glabrata TaxID=6526 RepID=A0A9W2YK12_BIOGL|nr:uncharacterized protein LOC129922177 [Biomphalaria glabrata]XP_055863109.1 uncharacterized protein LOC129922177 [Biomphalaria glabrata]
MATANPPGTGVLFDISEKLQKSQPGPKCDYGRLQPVEHDCSYCGRSAFGMKFCTNCLVAKYCDTECQVGHWPEHKHHCHKETNINQLYKDGRMVEMEIVPDTQLPEASANGDATRCTKNGDHDNFIAVKDFTLEHLPKEIRHKCVADYVLAESKITVKVLVKWISKNRPDTSTWAGLRGKTSLRNASGKFVLDNPHSFQVKDCPIPHCHRKDDLGPNHKIIEADLKIFTNKHVLYDEDELNRTEVDFFYDSKDKVGLVKEYATQLFYTKPSSDKTFFKVTIHDEELLHRLEQIDNDKSAAFWNLPSQVLRKMSAFAIVISHPHGMPKKISIGHVIRVSEENLTDETIANAKEAALLERTWFESHSEEDYLKFMAGLGRLNLPVYKIWYDTPTCKGSSGSPVIFGGRKCKDTWGPYMALHSACDIDSKLNYFKIVRFID